MNVCTACVSMRGLIYRSQGCLVSLTSAVNTVILNLHPAKGSKLRNNYARPRLEGVARTTRRRGVHGMNILLSISVSSVLHPPSREIILWKRNFPPNDLTRALESIKSNESVNFVNYISSLSFFSSSFRSRNLIFFPKQRLDVFTPADFSPSSSTICLRIRNAGNFFFFFFFFFGRKNFVTRLSRASSFLSRALGGGGGGGRGRKKRSEEGRAHTFRPVPFNLRGNIFGWERWLSSVFYKVVT